MSNLSQEIAVITGEQGLENFSEAQLERELTKYIFYLFEEKPTAVSQLLYRIDVSEEKAKAVFGAGTQDTTVAQDLARLIIERLKLKIKYREMYKGF